MSDTDQASEQSLDQRFQNYFSSQNESKSTPESAPAAETEPVQESSESVPEPEAEATEQATEQPKEESADFIDFEWNGKQYKLPAELAELKQGGLREADYRKKTQEVADLRRHATVINEQQKAAIEFQKVTADEQKELASLRALSDQYKKLEWAGMDMETMVRRQMEYQQVKEKVSDLQSTLGQKANQFRFDNESKHAERVRTTYDFISKHVPGFAADSAVEKEVASYVTSAGVPVEVFVNEALNNPPVAVLAWKAMQYDKLQQGKKQAVQAVQKAPPVVRPGSVTGNNAASDKRVQELRGQFKKTGDFRDAARLLIAAKRRG